MAEDTDAAGTDGSGQDSTAQLQRAAREVLGAARSFLDAVEELVEDRDKLHGAVESVTGVVGDLVAKVSPRRPSPWGEPDDVADDGWTDEGWAQEPDDAVGDDEMDEQAEPPAAAKKVRKIQVD